MLSDRQSDRLRSTMHTTPFSISQMQQKLGLFCQDRTDVIAMYLFGSHAEGVALPFSDIDIAVLPSDYAAGGDRTDDRLSLIKELGKALGTNDVDVCMLTPDISLPLVEQIFRHGKLLFSGNEEARIAFETQMQGKIFDFRPISQASTAAMEERFTRGTYGYRP